MTRRLALTLGFCAATVALTAGPALADGLGDDGTHYVCVVGMPSPNGPGEGVCVWVPMPINLGR